MKTDRDSKKMNRWRLRRKWLWQMVYSATFDLLGQAAISLLIWEMLTPRAIEDNLEVNAVTKDKDTALHYAAEKGR